MTKSEQASQLFSQKYSCAQSVLMAFAGDFGMDQATASKVACAFGGGISHMGLTCGAVAGALLAVGLRYGGGPDMKEGTYLKAREFMDRFTNIHGSTNCTELLGYNLAVPDQLARAREAGIFSEKCDKFVATAVKILEELL